MVLVPVRGKAKEVLWKAVECGKIAVESRREFARFLEGGSVEVTEGLHPLVEERETDGDRGRGKERMVPHKVLFDACRELQESGAQDAPRFEEVVRELAGSLELITAGDNAEDSRGERAEDVRTWRSALRERLVALERRQAELSYANMVADVAPAFAERQRSYGTQASSSSAYMATIRAQFSIGANVLATMLTCFAVGYFLARVYFGSDSPTPALVGGAVGLTIGLLLDVFIVITRMYAIERETLKPSRGFST